MNTAEVRPNDWLDPAALVKVGEAAGSRTIEFGYAGSFDGPVSRAAGAVR